MRALSVLFPVAMLRCWTTLVGLGGLAGLPVAHAASVGPPNIVWRNPMTGANKLWVMSGTNYLSDVALTPALDLNWKIVGIGDFGQGPGSLAPAHQPDIVWQHQVRGDVAFWFMDGTTMLTNVTISPVDATYSVVGVGDLDGDGQTDVVFYHKTDGYLGYWLMSGYQIKQTGIISPNNAGDLNWKIVGVAPFPRTNSPPALVWRHQLTGMNALWYMTWNGGTWALTNAYVIQSGGQAALVPDQDYRIVGAWDFDGDGNTDLLWHHATTSLTPVWLMNGPTNLVSAFLSYAAAPDWFNTDWKVATQDMIESRWRLNFEYGTPLSAAVRSSPPQITLNAHVPMRPNDQITVWRRVPPSTNWVNYAGPLATPFFVDSNVQSGTSYEYELGFTGPSGHLPAFIKAAIVRPAAALENRGTVVMLLDADLVNQFATPMMAVSNVVRRDLIADGWTVASYVAPRHAFANPGYTNSLQNITQFIRQQPGVKGVLIVGHVTIPYSGLIASDGHLDHVGAWPTDLFYGDTNGLHWTDTTVSNVAAAFPENWNIPGDGKFDQNYFPASVQLFVGRVDFANLPSFGTTSAASANEANLLLQYFNKAHNYRVNAPPLAAINRSEKGVVFNVFNFTRQNSLLQGIGSDATASIYENAVRNFGALFLNGIDNLDVGDPLFQKSSRSYLFGFLAGPGQVNRISDSLPSQQFPYLQHTSSDLASGSPGGGEAQIGFYLLQGSYFGDWNMSDNFLRSCIASPTFGLAATWIGNSPAFWEFHGLGLGETLGECSVTTVNTPLFPPINGYDDSARWVTIIGDPTLRLSMFQPPAGLTATISQGMVNLSWSPGAASAFNLYRSVDAGGPYALVTSVSATTITVPDDPQARFYMVRGVQLTTTGCGSYFNLSLGALAAAQ